MNGEEVEELLRRAGRPMPAPDRVCRAVYGLVGWRPPVVRSPRRLRAGLVVSAGLLLGSGLVATAVSALTRATTFPSVGTVELHGIQGASAVARLGAPNGPNRPVQLIVQHLEPGAQHSFELWSLNDHRQILLATFMTANDGACILILSAPSNLDWRDLVITPRGQGQEVVLCSAPTRC